jgi:hypothetical protein
MRVKVESVADHRGVATPRRFHLGRRRVDVVECDDQWPGADYRYVKVKGNDDSVYILRCDEPSGEWELTMFLAAASVPRKGAALRWHVTSKIA